MRPHQEFGRQVAGHLLAQIERRLRGRNPVVLHAVANGKRSRPVVVLRPQGGRGPTDRIAQVVDDAPSQCIGGQPGAAAFVGGGVGVVYDVGHRRIVTGVGNRKVNTRRMMYPCAGK